MAYWKSLNQLPRHEHNFFYLRQHFECTDIIRAWFDSTVIFDTQIQCDQKLYCKRHICEMPNGKYLAICDDNMGCPDLTIKKNDYRLHVLNLKKVARTITHLLQDECFTENICTIEEKISFVKIGYYVPRGTIKYPIFLGNPIYEGDIEQAMHHVIGLKYPAILLLPSVDNIKQSILNHLKVNEICILGLQDFEMTECLINDHQLKDAFFKYFLSLNDTQPEIKCKIFPTPPGVNWEKLIFEFEDEQLLTDNRSQKAHKREVITVICGQQEMRFEPIDLGMQTLNSKKPKQQWVLLREFIKNNGAIRWGDKAAEDRVKKQKQELIKVLKKAFCQSEDPIPYTKGKGYQCRFICRVVKK